MILNENINEFKQGLPNKHLQKSTLHGMTSRYRTKCRYGSIRKLFILLSIILFAFLLILLITNQELGYKLAVLLHLKNSPIPPSAQGPGYEMLAVLNSSNQIETRNQLAWCDQQTTNQNQPTILIISCSNPERHLLRQSIRETWGGYLKTKYNTILHFVFLVGQRNDKKLQEELQTESKKHNDIIIDNSFQDSYLNLTLKSLSAFGIFQSKCNQVKFLFKIDDDTIVNVDNLVYFLNNEITKLNKTSGYIIGLVEQHSKVIRDPFSKWYISPHVFPQDEFPPFVFGPGYILDHSAASNILNVARQQQYYIKLEDVYVTGILAQKANVPRISHQSFYNLKVTSGCEFKNLITAHYLSTPNEMKTLWEKTYETQLDCSWNNWILAGVLIWFCIFGVYMRRDLCYAYFTSQ